VGVVEVVAEPGVEGDELAVVEEFPKD